ncbi:HNH endonuclease signature motif containing protein [Clostridium disporicum]|uniref:Putative HNH nuclease YajD n=1 Tax=Clostridium disporicum TaxID=84024 RepID=A0A174AIL0_9CLOT|nr:HNH endonuclease signature motif containing protein [Clostridium disporicum]CUN87306.1 HNH endonuclease domain protein [Clostridium disporicum]
MAILYKCRRRGCMKLAEEDSKYCSLHKDIELQRYKEYKRNKRNDKEYKKVNDFYNTKEWTRLRDLMRSEYLGMCVVCWAKDKIEMLHTIHHVEEVRDNFDRRLDASNLIGLCSSCHKRVHDEYKKGVQQKKNMQKILFGLIRKFGEEFKRNTGGV